MSVCVSVTEHRLSSLVSLRGGYVNGSVTLTDHATSGARYDVTQDYVTEMFQHTVTIVLIFRHIRLVNRPRFVPSVRIPAFTDSTG
jgi:hypothetical protein